MISKLDIVQILKDAGCDEAFIERFLNSNCNPEKLSMLAKHRSALLAKLHEDQRALQRLDFLLHIMRKDDN